METPIPMDGADNSLDVGLDFDTEAAFLKSFMPPKKKDAPKQEPSDEVDEDDNEPNDVEEDEDTSEESDESPDDEEDDDESEDEDDSEDDDEEEDEKGKRKLAESDAYVKVKVGDEEHEVPISKLTRLWGQEAALTRKSQEVAAEKKAVDEKGARFVAATQTLLQKAQEAWEPYSKIDWLVAAKELEADELSALRTEAKKSWDNLEYLKNGLDNTMKQAEAERRGQLAEMAKKTIAELSDPNTGIKGWGEPLYDEIRSFAIDKGLPAEVVNDLVDASAIRLLHMAMLYEKGQKAITKTKKIDKTPKKIIKSTKSNKTSKAPKSADAMAKLKKSGKQDDAAEAFLAMWTQE